MTEREQLLRAVLDNPEEDTVRLVYADHLQENGQPERAEFIRVQIELARAAEPKNHRSPRCAFAHPDPDKCERCRHGFMQIRERNLRGAYAPQWYSFGPYAACSVWDHAPLIRWCQPPFQEDVITGDDYRGFVSSVSLPLHAFTDDFARDLFSQHPVTTVHCLDRQPIRHNGGYVWGMPHRFAWRQAQGHSSILPDWAAPLAADILAIPARFPSADAAHAWLSAKAVAHGRRLAKLSRQTVPATA